MADAFCCGKRRGFFLLKINRTHIFRIWVLKFEISRKTQSISKKSWRLCIYDYDDAVFLILCEFIKSLHGFFPPNVKS